MGMILTFACGKLQIIMIIGKMEEEVDKDKDFD
jgi:hypothetical protein